MPKVGCTDRKECWLSTLMKISLYDLSALRNRKPTIPSKFCWQIKQWSTRVNIISRDKIDIGTMISFIEHKSLRVIYRTSGYHSRIKTCQTPASLSVTMSHLHNFDFTTSSLYFTSFNTLVVGFHSSNCFRSSAVSWSSSVLTRSSSSSPLMLQGSWKGLELVKTSYCVVCKGTFPTELVSNANETATLLN